MCIVARSSSGHQFKEPVSSDGSLFRDDWEIGKHGIIIEFSDPVWNCRRSATFLPDVPREQGWDKEATIDALIRKAGCSTPPSPKIRAAVHLVRYQSSLCSVTYHDFWAVKRGGTFAPQLNGGHTLLSAAAASN